MFTDFPWYRLVQQNGFLTLTPATNDYAKNPGSGIAISYVWGAPRPSPVAGKEEYNHHVLPVVGGHSTNTITIKLGDIWDIKDFINVLWKATQGQPFWLDQLALRQDAESLQANLATQIPGIYKQHTVKVIMNTWQCKLVEDWKGLKFDSEREIRGERAAFLSHLVQCVNCCHMSGWLSRLWPRQEAYFAKDLQLVYPDPPSPYGPRSVRLPPSRNTPVDQLDIIYSLQAMISDKLDRPLFRTGPVVHRNNGQEVWDPTAATAFTVEMKLLAGHAMTFEKPVNFERSLCRLGMSSKFVTKPKDLVLAVWYDLVGYKAPAKVKTMPVRDLFWDACHQYHRITGRTVPVALIWRFIGKPQTASLLPFLISPAPVDTPNTMSWYQQWTTPNKGLKLDKKNMLRGNISKQSYRCSPISRYILFHPTAKQAADSLSLHSTCDSRMLYHRQLMQQVANFHSAGVRVSPTLWKVGMILELSIYGRLQSTEPAELVTNFAYSMVDEDTIRALVMLCLQIPVGYRVIPAVAQGSNRMTSSVSSIRFSKEICFFETSNGWLPTFCTHPEGEVRLMKADGFERVWLVHDASRNKGDWVVIGMVPHLSGIPGETFSAMCR